MLDAGEDILDIFSFSCAKADIQKDADDESCHVVKEIVRMDQDLHLFSVSIDLDIINLPLGILALFGGRKVAEIMLPKEQKRCLLHQLFVRDLEAVEGVFPLGTSSMVMR